MARPRLSIRRPALAAALLLAGALLWAPFAISQNGDTTDSDSKIGTRERETREVNWPALKSDEVERGRMDPSGILLEAPPMVASATRAELTKARLPVLLPDDGRMVERMRLFAERDHYVASLRGEDYSVQITGTRISQGPMEAEGAAGRMRQMSDEEGYVYQRTEYGCELSFTRYNVSYNISVECREPEADPRCTKRDFVMQLARSLVYVGGRPESEENP